MKSYGVQFEVISDDHTVQGAYAVSGENYRIEVGDAEVYGDAKLRYEIDNKRREITIDNVNKSSRNILDNPVRAFDFIGSDYTAVLMGDTGGETTIRLTPTSKAVSAAGAISVTVDTATMRPLSLLYDYDGDEVRVVIRSVEKLATPPKRFDKADYKGYEFIDFR